MLKGKEDPCTVNSDQTNTAQGRTAAAKGDKKKGSRKQAVTAENAPSFALAWKEDHPDAYALMARTAIDMKRRGLRPSMDDLAAKLRASDHPNNRQKPGEPFKLNNTLKASLARMLMNDFPELKGMFRVRKSRADKVFCDE